VDRKRGAGHPHRPDGAEAFLGARSVDVHSVAAHGHALPQQELALPLSLRDGSVRVHNAVPRHVLVSRRQDATDQAWRVRVDVAVGLDVSRRDVAYPLEDRLRSTARW